MRVGLSILPIFWGAFCAILRAMTTLDATDAKLLLALTQTPRASGVELAQRLNLSRNTVQARLTRWDQHEALAGIDHQIVPRAMGYPMTAYVTARIDQHQLAAIGGALADVPEVVQVHGLAGADDLMIKVVAVDSDDLYRIAGNILDIPGITRTSIAIAMHELVAFRMTPLLRRLAGQE